MARKIDPARVCLHIQEWPAADQDLWNRAVNGDRYESDAKTRAAWSPTSAQTNREGYGRWLNHLMRSGADLNLTPAERVTPEQVRAYLHELKEQGLAPQTGSNRISQLLSVMLVFAPEKDWDWLRRRFNRLEAIAKESRKPRPLDILSGDILDRSLKEMKKIRTAGDIGDVAQALDYRNWLMLAVLTLTTLRRDNFAIVSIESHFRWCNGELLLEVPAGRVKQKKPITMPVPAALNEAIAFYLDVVRPLLLDGRITDRLWITVQHTPITPHSVYIAITNFTRKVFGKAINPHRLRHISATSIVIADPAEIESSRALLTHSDTKMTEDHYVIAQSLAASRRQAALIANMRKRLPAT